MAYEQKDNSGALFRNDRKESESHPDYKGDAKIGGASYWVSGWINEKKGDGAKYLKLSYKPKDAQPAAAPPPAKADADDPFGDEIPF